jgi:hypothetical protein
MASELVEESQEFARDHPYVAFGVLLIPVTWGVTGDALTSLFVGGAVAFGPALAEGFSELNDDEDAGNLLEDNDDE